MNGISTDVALTVTENSVGIRRVQVCSQPTMYSVYIPAHSIFPQPTIYSVYIPAHSMCSPPITYHVCIPAHNICLLPAHNTCLLPAHNICLLPAHTICFPARNIYSPQHWSRRSRSLRTLWASVASRLRAPLVRTFVYSKVNSCRPVHFTDPKTRPLHESSPSPWQQRSPSLSRGRRPPLNKSNDFIEFR